MQLRTLVIAFQGAAVTGLVGSLLLENVLCLGVTIVAALAVWVAASLVASSAPAVPAARVGAALRAPPREPAPASLLPARPTTSAHERVPLYDERDFEFIKPWPWMDITQQNLFRPTAERTVQPLEARQKFVKFWAQDSDAFATKDMYCIPRGGKQIIQQRF